MCEPLANSFFRVLDEEEEQEFRASARENYELGTVVNGLFHPAYRAECELMNLEDNRVVGQPDDRPEFPVYYDAQGREHQEF